MITAALEHSEPLKGFDGARALPKSLGARYRLEGVVRRDQDSTVVILRLHDARGDSLIAQESASGPNNGPRPYQLGLLALRPLLPRMLDPGRKVDLAPLSERKVSAVALWLQGERKYRLGQFGDALPLYQRAVAEDSSLVLAAVKGAQAASWENRFQDAGNLSRLALAHESLLPARYAHFARGVSAYVAGQADSALAWFEKALSASPDWSEARMAAGEVAYHLMPVRPPPAPDSTAEANFLHALAEDPGFLPPAVHLAEIALGRGELSRADKYVKLLKASPPDSMLVRQLQLMRSCIDKSLPQAGWQAAALVSAETVLRAGRLLAAGGAYPACAETAFRSVLASKEAAYHWGAMLGVHGVLAAQRRTAELVHLVDSAAAAGTVVARNLYFFDALAGLPVDSQARAFAEFVTTTYGDSLQKLGHSPAGARTRWLVGSWWIHDGAKDRAGPLEPVIARIADSLTSRSAALFAAALDAGLMLARGDSAQGRAALARLNPNAPRDSLQWELGESLPHERLLAAELALRGGKPGEALRLAAGFDHPEPIIYPAYLPASLELRARAAEALGRGDLASEFRGRLRKLLTPTP
jgi:tetratricopeptide (TPR) repeat protein